MDTLLSIFPYDNVIVMDIVKGGGGGLRVTVSDFLKILLVMRFHRHSVFCSEESPSFNFHETKKGLFILADLSKISSNFLKKQVFHDGQLRHKIFMFTHFFL